jgi:hypothetical protein
MNPIEMQPLYDAFGYLVGLVVATLPFVKNVGKVESKYSPGNPKRLNKPVMEGGGESEYEVFLALPVESLKRSAYILGVVCVEAILPPVLSKPIAIAMLVAGGANDATSRFPDILTPESAAKTLKELTKSFKKKEVPWKTVNTLLHIARGVTAAALAFSSIGVETELGVWPMAIMVALGLLGLGLDLKLHGDGFKQNGENNGPHYRTTKKRGKAMVYSHF